jgi:hypothetical protein
MTHKISPYIKIYWEPRRRLRYEREEGDLRISLSHIRRYLMRHRRSRHHRSTRRPHRRHSVARSHLLSFLCCGRLGSVFLIFLVFCVVVDWGACFLSS